MTTSVEVMLGVWNALILGGGAVAIIRRKQLVEWIARGDDLHRGQVADDDVWEAFLAQHPELR